jgi:hypothetical protein
MQSRSSAGLSRGRVGAETFARLSVLLAAGAPIV